MSPRPADRSTVLVWVLQLLVAVILGQTLFFKFTAAPESVAIFEQLGAEPAGRIATGLGELVAVFLVLLPSTAAAGGLLAAGMMAGAIVSHLTILGIEVQGDGGLLFGLACTVLISGLAVARMRWSQLRWRPGAPTVATLAFASLFASVLFLPESAHAIDRVNTTTFGNLAIKGFDPVAYFEDGTAVKGKKDYAIEWMGANWRFATAEHRDRFARDPERYAPQYGGYCAYAVSQGSTASIDPEAWSIVEGKLYLNYSPDIRKRWEEDVAGNIQRADVQWPQLLED